jgi:adenylosuccinate lyase
MNNLEAISPIDGRYKKYTASLVPYFSEAASMKYKVLMEGEYLIALSEVRGVGLRRLTSKEKNYIRNFYNRFSVADAKIISKFELTGFQGIKATNHDFKAIEYFIKHSLAKTSLKDCLEWVHFGLTSYDATNVATALMVSESLRDVVVPVLEDIVRTIGNMAKANASVAMLARTHGQSASPTTFGKEFKVFYTRLERQLLQLKNMRVQAKLNGATGNYNALAVAYPKVPWIAFSKKYIGQLNKERKLNLEVNLYTTQIEPYDSFAEVFDCLRRINTILIDFNQDMWRYISDGWIAQKPVAGEVGSSTMPHKINPWFLENSEGNLSLANALFGFFATKLPISRLQRDLSDSTVIRNIGVAFGHCLIGYKYLANQLGRLVVHKANTLRDLEARPEVLAEAIQTILRREGVPMPYEQLKELTRGKEMTLISLRKFIDSLAISAKAKRELRVLTPAKYTGLARQLARSKE